MTGGSGINLNALGWAATMCDDRILKYRASTADRKCQDSQCNKAGSRWNHAGVFFIDCPVHMADRFKTIHGMTVEPKEIQQEKKSHPMPDMDKPKEPENKQKEVPVGKKPSLDANPIGETTHGCVPAEVAFVDSDNDAGTDDADSWDELEKALIPELSQQSRGKPPRRSPSADEMIAEPGDSGRRKPSLARRASFLSANTVESDPGPSSASPKKTVRNKTVRERGHLDHLPSFLKKALPRSTDVPVELDTDVRFKQSMGAKPRERVANTIASSLKEANEDAKESEYTSLIDNTIFALRGFGEFDVVIGAGAKGRALTKCIRDFANNRKDKQMEGNLRCLITNRLAIAAGTLKWGAKRLEGVGENTALLYDFLLSDMENRASLPFRR